MPDPSGWLARNIKDAHFQVGMKWKILYVKRRNDHENAAKIIATRPRWWTPHRLHDNNKASSRLILRWKMSGGKKKLAKFPVRDVTRQHQLVAVPVGKRRLLYSYNICDPEGAEGLEGKSWGGRGQIIPSPYSRRRHKSNFSITYSIDSVNLPPWIAEMSISQVRQNNTICLNMSMAHKTRALFNIKAFLKS